MASIELRILSGSREGQRETFDQLRIAIGRHPTNDLRFDPFKDLDVSTRHGEIRRNDDGSYVIRDNNSTNGTFVNGARLEPGDQRALVDGDTISFGANGPKVGVRLVSAPAVEPSAPTPPRPRVMMSPTVEIMSVSPALPPRATPPEVVEPPQPPQQPQPERASQQPSAPPASDAGTMRQHRPPRPPRIDPMRRPTQERVAMAVAKETRGLKIAVGAAIIVLGGLGFGAYWMGHSEARAADARMQALMLAFDSSSKQLQASAQSVNDTALVRRLAQQKDSVERVARSAHGGEAAVVQQSLQRHQDATRAIGELDLPAVHSANDNAVVLIRTEFGRARAGLEATGFAVSSRGFVVTNRHVVTDGKTRATKLSVKFANTDAWRPAHLVRTPNDTSIDLALIQLDDVGGKTPVVSGIAPSVDVPVGGPIASLGFPDGSDLPMDGANAKTTLTLGTVSKLTNDLVQIDSYASHGSSGSPVFDSHGHVIGVIFGGAPGSGGRIVYAVPAGRIAELVKGAR